MWIEAKNGAQVIAELEKAYTYFYFLFLAFPCLDVGAGGVCVMKKVKQNGALALGALGIIL